MTRRRRGGYPRSVGSVRPKTLYACLVLLSLSVLPASADQAQDRSRLSIEQSLKELGIPYTAVPLLADYGGFGASIYVDIPGREAGDGLIVVAAPYYYRGAGTDPSIPFGAQAALGLAARLSAAPLPRPVRIAFLADEESTIPADLRPVANLGLRALAADLRVPERSPVLYLDLEKSGTGLQIRHGSKRRIAPLALVEALTRAAGAAGYVIPIAVPFNELYRLALIDGPEALRILHAENVPALAVTELSGTVHPAPDTDAFIGIAADAVARLSAEQVEADERYAFLSLGSLTVPLPEGISVILFLSAAALISASVLVYSLTHRHLMIARWKVFAIRAWTLVLFFVALAASERGASLVLDFSLRVFGASPETHPYGAAALKLLLSLAFYYGLALLLERAAVPKRPHFYSTAATFLFFAGALAAAVADITFVPVFVWAVAISFVSSAAKAPALAVLAALLAPLQIVLAAFAVVGSGDPAAALALIRGGFAVEAYLAFAALPYLLLFKRASLLSRAGAARRRGRRPLRSKVRPLTHHRWTWALFSAGVLAATAAFSANAAADAKNAPKVVRERVPAEGASLVVRTGEVAFLDRRTVSITVDSSLSPDRIDLTIETAGKITIYDATAPFAYSDDGSRAVFRLGEAPPEKFSLEVTVPADLSATIRTEAVRIGGETHAGEDYARIDFVETPLGRPR